LGAVSAWAFQAITTHSEDTEMKRIILACCLLLAACDDGKPIHGISGPKTSLLNMATIHCCLYGNGRR
jgi:hypothetical protein